ncbi:MAG: minichromosome maintenance protein MCM [archaeon]
MELSEISQRFSEFLAKTDYYKKLVETASKGGRSFFINFADLEKYDPDLSDELLERPLEVLPELESASALMAHPTKERIFIRIFSLPESKYVKLKDLRTKHLGKLVEVEGLIRQASEVRPEVMEITFECLDCGNRTTVLQTTQVIRKPAKCICGKSAFREGDKTFRDLQSLKVEESPERLTGGEQPSRIDVILQDDLVEPSLRERLTPGNRVKLVGVMKEKPVTLRTGVRSKIFDVYLQAIFVENTVQEFEKLELTKEDEGKIIEMSKDPKIKDKIIASIAPSIYGNEKIKEAIALQLFGGVMKVRSDGMKTRGEIHIFLVGDPGSGKSQLLRYVSTLSPKSMYVSGKGATGAGLTAVVVRDEFLGGWALEAGAVVLCNRGLCAIDEMDKMAPDDRVAMHEVMEQGTVSIAKANIHANLRAETSILAAANPKLSRFDPRKDIMEQIDMPQTLLSRFDLTFIVRDVPNKERDENLADHILLLHKQPNRKNMAPIETDFLRKYISYSKKNFSPKLTAEAVEEIKQFYVGLRTKHGGESEELQAIPISARQLEAMVRLSEGNARLRFSNTVTAEDARQAIDLMRYCLYQVGFDPETGKLDIARLEGGVTATKRNRINIVTESVKELEKESQGKSFKRRLLIERAVGKGVTEDEANKVVEALLRDGTLFAPRVDEIQRTP